MGGAEGCYAKVHEAIAGDEGLALGPHCGSNPDHAVLPTRYSRWKASAERSDFFFQIVLRAEITFPGPSSA